MLRTLPLLLTLVAAPALAGSPVQSDNNLGIGLGGGTHVSGLSAKYFVGTDLAIQGVVGTYGVGRGNDGGGIGVSADLLLERPPLLRSDALDIAWNIGLGANVGVGDPLFLGANGVAGLEFNINPVPIDVVLEYRPGLHILPTVGADLIGFGAHIRVYPF